MLYIPRRNKRIISNIPNPLYIDHYSFREQNLLNKLKMLFSDWHKMFKLAQGKSRYLIGGYSANDLSFDGFYPGYLSQKIKILYIGRESRNIPGDNYLGVVYNAIKNNKIGCKPINRHEFHRRILYLTFAINTGQKNYNKIPFANTLSVIFGTHELSFAFMNISKISNKNSYYIADYKVINKAVEISVKQRNFINEEIQLLNPDIIITMNLKNYFNHIGSIFPIRNIRQHSSTIPYEFKMKNKSILLLDTYHFSAILSEKTTFFDPIIRNIMKYKSRFDLRVFDN